MTRRIYPDLATFFAESGVTQEQLAERLAISQSHMSRIKNGMVDVPMSLATRIAKEAHIPLESLLKDASPATLIE